MFWKKENKTEKRLQQMNELLKKSFANVKRDTTGIFQWINYFYRKSLEQEQTIRRLQIELSYMPKTRDDIRHIIDDYYSFEGIMAKIRGLNARVDDLEKVKYHSVSDVHPVLREPHIDMSNIERRLDKLEQKKPSIREKIIRRLTRNSKEYIKGVMLSYIKKYERISALQLKEIIVEEQNLCSKSSFYRLLEEIEGLDDIGIIKQGKEKHYVAKAKAYVGK